MILTPTPAPPPANLPLSASANLMGYYGGGGQFGETDAAGGEGATVSPKPRALVVDDAPDVTEMIALLLQYAGYEVTTVYSGRQALDAARGDSFDVVVSDIGMPGMNGYELAEQLRRFEQYHATPMIAVTGFSMYDDRDRALAAGFNAFLTKPVNPRDLISLVERLRG
ncbi:MAG TPA: response regulator [Pyrinomonadaceae bacterium]|jgi:CheY-like chemotaxis protein|nr:response regulator [Pyrinomonadaceae bacterium]